MKINASSNYKAGIKPSTNKLNYQKNGLLSARCCDGRYYDWVITSKLLRWLEAELVVAALSGRRVVEDNSIRHSRKA